MGLVEDRSTVQEAGVKGGLCVQPRVFSAGKRQDADQNATSLSTAMAWWCTAALSRRRPAFRGAVCAADSFSLPKRARP